PRVIALEGCSIGRTLAWPERRTYGSEILIDGHLEVGQQAVLAYRMEMSAKERNVRGMFYTVPRRAHDIMIEIEFRGPSTPVDRKSTRLNSSHVSISYAVFCLKKKKAYSFLTMYDSKHKP